MPMIATYGGRPIWMGNVTDALIAPQGEAWTTRSWFSIRRADIS
ncbi:MAG: hypothetical protein ABGW98_12325 [Myxococcales bacterium]